MDGVSGSVRFGSVRSGWLAALALALAVVDAGAFGWEGFLLGGGGGGGVIPFCAGLKG